MDKLDEQVTRLINTIQDSVREVPIIFRELFDNIDPTDLEEYISGREGK